MQVWETDSSLFSAIFPLQVSREKKEMASQSDQDALTGPPAVLGSDFLDSPFRYALFPAAYGLLFILGLLANLYVLVVLRWLREAKAMGEIRIYMTNLTIADLLFVCALPFWIDYYRRGGNWIPGDFMCRLTGSLFFINTYCSILFLGAISINRYWAVTRPLDAASSDHRLRGIIVSIFIWVLTVSMAAPQLASPGTNVDEVQAVRCFEGYHNRTDSEKKTVAATHFAIIGLFFVVFALVLVCNLLIAQALLSSNATSVHPSRSTKSLSPQKPHGVKRKALQMLLAVVGVFVVCFLPHHVIQGAWTLAVLQIQQGWGHVGWGQGTRQALNDAHQITLLLMGLNCILDPVVYWFATRKFRRYILTNIRRLRKGDSCSKTVISELSVDDRNQSQMLPVHRELEMQEREHL